MMWNYTQNSVCYKCKDRYVGCHNIHTCEKYAKEVKDREELMKEVKKQKNYENQWINYTRQSRARSNK